MLQKCNFKYAKSQLDEGENMQLIENLFGSRSRIKALKKLSKHKDWWFNITELSKDIGMNKGGLSKILNRLEKENLIIMNRKGKIKIFKINGQNIFVSNVIVTLFKMEEGFFSDIKKKITEQFPEKQIVSIILYGSYAKGLERLDSDIDLMVIAENKVSERKCKIIAEKLSSEFLNKGLMLTIDIIIKDEFRKLYLQKEPSIKSIAETGIVLEGKNIEELIR